MTWFVLAKRVNIAGVGYRGVGASFVLTIRPGATLELEAETDNPADRHAVKVIRNGTHIGYVPARHLAPIVSRLLLQGYRLRGKMRDPQEPTFDIWMAGDR